MMLAAYDQEPAGTSGSPLVTPIGRSGQVCPERPHPVALPGQRPYSSWRRTQPSVGGLLRIDIEDGGSSLYVTGRYVELDRPRRLRFTWSCSDWADPTVQSVVTVTLEGHGPDETMMTIEHEQLPAGERDDHRDGWTAISAQLGKALVAR
jgi:hypothetical protein